MPDAVLRGVAEDDERRLGARASDYGDVVAADDRSSVGVEDRSGLGVCQWAVAASLHDGQDAAGRRVGRIGVERVVDRERVVALAKQNVQALDGADGLRGDELAEGGAQRI